MSKVPAPPKHLSTLARRVWREVLEAWELDPTGLLLLRGGLEQWDTYTRAREELGRADSVTVTSDTGVVRQHPAAKVALDALSEARQCFRQLGLELPDPEAGWRANALGRRGPMTETR